MSHDGAELAYRAHALEARKARADVFFGRRKAVALGQGRLKIRSPAPHERAKTEFREKEEKHETRRPQDPEAPAAPEG